MASHDKDSKSRGTNNQVTAPTDTTKLDLREVHPNFQVRVVGNGKNSTMIYVVAQPGASLGEHEHPHEQIGYCLKGGGKLTIGDKTYSINKDHSFIIPPNIPHSLTITSKEEYVAIEIFSPARPDLLKNTFKPDETK